jgi:hypothetical protein
VVDAIGADEDADDDGEGDGTGGSDGVLQCEYADGTS